MGSPTLPRQQRADDRRAVTDRPVIVGVDISAEVIDALRWALRAASEREILLVHAVDRFDAELARSAQLDPNVGAVARTLLELYRTIAMHIAPEAVVRTAVLEGDPAPALIDASRDASLVVLGSRGLAGVARSALGSVANRVAVHAACPVVVVPATARDRSVGAIVVGLADKPAGQRAVEFAAESADSAGKTLLLVQSTQLRGSARRPTIQYACDRLATVAARYPDLAVRITFTDQGAAEALAGAAREADLLVVGCHHADDPFNARLGSVPAALLGRVDCPIALVGPPLADVRT